MNVPSWRDAAVWLAFGLVFLLLELPPAIVTSWPWNTLSSTTWRFEHWWHLARILIALFLLALAVHLLWHVPARWLEVVAICAAVGAVGRLVWELVA